MSMDFVPARRPNPGDTPSDYQMSIQRSDRSARGSRPTSLYIKIAPDVIADWGVKDGVYMTGHFSDGIWEVRPCKDGQPGFVFRVSGKFGGKVRTCPEGWGSLRLSCTKSQADKSGVTAMKFFELAEIKGGSAFFIEKEQGIGFYPARRRAV